MVMTMTYKQYVAIKDINKVPLHNLNKNGYSLAINTSIT
jgi:hypothetical protein